MKEEIYDIGGMRCASCSVAVERVTQRLPGVRSSDVNLPMNRLTITYDETLCTAEAICQAVEEAGFSASPHVQTVQKTPDARVLSRKRWALAVSVTCSFVLLLVSMGQMLFPGLPIPSAFSMTEHPFNLALLELALTVPVLFLCRRFFTGGFRSLLHGNPNMDTLVALSASASLVYSLVMTAMLAVNPNRTDMTLYYESAAMVVSLVSLGKYLEASNQEKTKGAIQKLMTLAPDIALLVDGTDTREVPTAAVQVGDVILVKPGARIPLDGAVISGTGSVNEAMLTGESLPVDKSPGNEVIGGSVSVDGAFYVRVTRVGRDTTLSKIIQFVEDAQGKKAPISKSADKVAGVFVPIVLVVSLLAAVGWLVAGEPLAFAVKIFTSVLVIACPCAMGLATPTAIIVGTGLGASHGILVRSGEALELSSRITVAAFDKTGTITKGKPAVTDIVSQDEEALLHAAVSLEALSNHPLAHAIRDAAEERGISGGSVTNFESIAGRGLRATDGEGRTLLAGSAALLTEHGIPISPYEDACSQLQSYGKTVVLVAQNGQTLGLLAIFDEMKGDARETLSTLHAMGIDTVLLTGDHRAAAEYIGAQAGFTAVVAEVLPTQKAEVISHYQKMGKTVLMVGDGINDAPALVQANVGCAIGSGSDIAMDSADIVLMSPALSDVCRAIRLGRLTLRSIRQNLFWAFCYNTLGIPIAAGVLYPALGLLLSPAISGAAMSLSSLFVVANALRLKGKSL